MDKSLAKFHLQDTAEPAADIAIHRAGSATERSPADIASAPFWLEQLATDIGDGRPGAISATLEPGTITRWHSHPRGQILYVLSGVGLVQREGGPISEIRAGDCVVVAPGERHWHGAADYSTFAYISIQGSRDGSAVSWFEPVDPTVKG